MDLVKIGCSSNFYGQKANFAFSGFSPFWRSWRHNDVTLKIVFILVGMDKGDQDLYISTNSTALLDSYYRKSVGGCNNAFDKIFYEKQPG